MYFMQSGESNKLVDFLNNSGNTSVMKDAVLQAIQFNKEGGGAALALSISIDRQEAREWEVTKAG